MTDDVPIRDAATIVLVRDTAAGPAVLMGQRGSKAAFMANKFVFPGGAVDAADGQVPTARALDKGLSRQLAHLNAGPSPEALVNAVIRELWEETGQIMGAVGPTPDVMPPDWHGFLSRGLLPAPDPMRFFFRAVTPPGRPRRFDARFFFAEADALVTDPDDFSGASGELAHLQWVPLGDARGFPVPFITDLVLAEVQEIWADRTARRPVPFFHQSADGPEFISIDPGPV